MGSISRVRISSKVVRLEGEEQQVAVLIPDPELLEALDAWARHCTERDIDMPPSLGKSIATLLDMLDEELNPEVVDEEEYV